MSARSGNYPFSARLFSLLLLVVLGTGCASTQARRSSASPSVPEFSRVGLASYYANKFHGKRTASGERYNMQKMTAAHRSLPFDTEVKVTHMENRRSTVVRINDRGPFVRNRIIDVSLAAARELGMVQAGVARVKLEVLGINPGKPRLVSKG